MTGLHAAVVRLIENAWTPRSPDAPGSNATVESALLSHHNEQRYSHRSHATCSVVPECDFESRPEFSTVGVPPPGSSVSL
jgi:hypothetical protein